MREKDFNFLDLIKKAKKEGGNLKYVWMRNRYVLVIIKDK